MNRTVTAVGGALVAVLLGACGGQSFSQRDPHGFQACSDWQADVSRGDATSIVGGLLAVADVARESTTKSIRDAVSNLASGQAVSDQSGMGLIDSDKFEKACKANGNFDFKKAKS